MTMLHSSPTLSRGLVFWASDFGPGGTGWDFSVGYFSKTGLLLLVSLKLPTPAFKGNLTPHYSLDTLPSQIQITHSNPEGVWWGVNTGQRDVASWFGLSFSL